MMQMIGLRDVTLNAQDEFGRSQLINFRTDEPVEVPDAFATTAKSLGYARPVEETTDAQPDA